MQYHYLGSAGVPVSRLCMGAMTFGREADKATSAALYGRCRDAGINCFDCANGYAGGESERILGELIEGHRVGGSSGQKRGSRLARRLARCAISRYRA